MPPSALSFQFPSNGKGFPNLLVPAGWSMDVLSFNSLQTGKAFRTNRESGNRPEPPTKSFNSLQTGKAFRTEKFGRFRDCAVVFQFPSNGKGFPNTLRVTSEPCHYPQFQFPSNGKGFPNYVPAGVNSRLVRVVSIPFKRERLSELKPIDLSTTTRPFQFPSNGKGFPNLMFKFI